MRIEATQAQNKASNYSMGSVQNEYALKKERGGGFSFIAIQGGDRKSRRERYQEFSQGKAKTDISKIVLSTSRARSG